MGNPPNRRRWVKAVRYAAYCAAALALLAIAAALVLPALLDTPAVRVEIQRQLSAAIRGEVTWEDLSLRILPAPHGALHKVRVGIPEVARISAERVDASLRLWSLLRGRAKITSVALVKPDIRIDLQPAPSGEEKPEQPPGPDIAALYQSVMGPVVQGVREFAPDTVIEIDNAEVDVRAPDMPPIQLSRLTLRARTGRQGMDLDATAASPYWDRLKLSARIEFADLSAKASLDAGGVKPQAWLDQFLAKSPVGVAVPSSTLSARARTDGKTSLECEFAVGAGRVDLARGAERLHVPDVAVKGKVVADAREIVVHVGDIRLGASRLEGGALTYSPRNGGLAGDIGYDLEVAQGLDATRRLVPAAAPVLSWLRPATGRVQGRVRLALHSDWHVAVHIAKSDAAIQVRDLPGPVRLNGGAVDIDRHKVKLDRVALSLPAGTVLLSSLQHLFKDDSTAGEASFDLDVARWLELARRALPQENREALADVETAAGRVEGKAKFTFGRGDWKFGVNVLKSSARIGLRQLPGPVTIARWSIDAGPASATIHDAAISLLDASVVASMTVDEFDSGPRIRGAIAEGSVGENFLSWVWSTAKLPARYEPAAPIRIAAPGIAWRPGGAVEVQASAQFKAGPSVAADLGWNAGVLDIRRMTIQDGRNNATLALRVKGTALEGRYTGALRSTSIAAVLKRTKIPPGSIAGDLRFTIDRAHPERMTAEGHLKGEALDLASLTGQPLVIERIDMATDDNALHVREAAVSWAGQRATIRGDVRRGADGPVIDAQIDSPGVNLDALLQATDRAKKPADEKVEQSRVWPLPVTGQFVVNSGFLQRGRYRVAPIAATLSLQPERAHLDLSKAQLCGISFPLTIDATPGGLIAAAKIRAEKQQLDQAVRCLTDQHVLITGEFDLSADISSQGRVGEFARNLKGAVAADMRDGRVMKFALLGNILSMENVSKLLKDGGPKLDAAGFPYRNLKIAGRFDAGRFVLDEGAFQSDAAGLAANGWISLTEPQSRLTVLVAPFSRLDQLVRDVPIVGYVVGGTLTSVPVGVSGDIRDPLVVPLGPRAVGSEVLGIFERTLKLPAKVITPLEGK